MIHRADIADLDDLHRYFGSVFDAKLKAAFERDFSKIFPFN